LGSFFQARTAIPERPVGVPVGQLKYQLRL